MSIQKLSESVPFAMKDYPCDSCTWLRESDVLRGTGTGLTFSELRAVAIAKSHNWMILKGERYDKQINKQDGDLYVFRSIPAMLSICHKLDLFSDC